MILPLTHHRPAAVGSLPSAARDMQPLVLLGMHRSGTSLTVRLLADLGFHMGSWLSRDAEAVHFQRLNRRIFGAAGSRWAEVDGLLEQMGSADFVQRQAEATWRALSYVRPLAGGSVLRRFFGPETWRRLQQGEAVPWGWKDPRTTLTFPIWLEILPRARWVHIVRNGVDVAISIHRRSLVQRRKLRNRLFPIDFSPVTLDFGYCFGLWETYLSFVLEHRALIPEGHYLEMRYEDLLAQPEANLRLLAEFAGYPAGEAALAAACHRIDAGRLDNTRHASNYRQQIPALASRPLMQQLGYGYDIQ